EVMPCQSIAEIDCLKVPMLPCATVRPIGVLLATVMAGCAVAHPGAVPPAPAPSPPPTESFRIAVVYPAATDVIQSHDSAFLFGAVRGARGPVHLGTGTPSHVTGRSEEHTSELQSLRHLVCRLLLEKKKKIDRIQFQ